MNTRLLISAIVALAWVLSPAGASASTYVYRGVVVVTGVQSTDDIDPLTPSWKVKVRKKLHMIVILTAISTDKTLFLIDRKAKTFDFDPTPLDKPSIRFEGVNGRSIKKYSYIHFPSRNFQTMVDRDLVGGTDTITTKAGALEGRLREFNVLGIPVFEPRALKGRFTTTRYSDVITDYVGGFDPGSEFTLFQEKVSLRLHRRDTEEFFFDTVADTTADLATDLALDGFALDSQIFTDGFESGDTSAWSSSSAP